MSNEILRYNNKSNVDESVSVLSTVPETENLVVLKKMRFGGDPVFACGKNLPEFDCEISASEQAVGTVIFEKNSALKNAQRKITDSRDSLYIRIKKLAIKFDSLERLYRAKGNCVFFKLKDAEERAKRLFAVQMYSSSTTPTDSPLTGQRRYWRKTVLRQPRRASEHV